MLCSCWTTIFLHLPARWGSRSTMRSRLKPFSVLSVQFSVVSWLSNTFAISLSTPFLPTPPLLPKHSPLLSTLILPTTSSYLPFNQFSCFPSSQTRSVPTSQRHTIDPITPLSWNPSSPPLDLPNSASPTQWCLPSHGTNTWNSLQSSSTSLWRV